MSLTPEHVRLKESEQGEAWSLWGPYLSDRQWGTVREDYSANGNAWDYFPFQHSHMRAYRWGEDGLGGISDSGQRLCASVALWNGKDPILKERLFGLPNEQGNHGEDVKEVYFYLDATPTHSYLKYLYKYPQAAFPYQKLQDENRRRSRLEAEYELVDTGVFDENRYFDIQVEYAKADAHDILMRVTATNRGPDPADLWLLPQVWYRNTWAWEKGTIRPIIRYEGPGTLRLMHPDWSDYRLHFEYPQKPPTVVGEGGSGVTGFGATQRKTADASPATEHKKAPVVLFTDNETNTPALYGSNDCGYFKDGFNQYVVHDNKSAVHPDRTGTKVGFLQKITLAPGASTTMRIRMRNLGLEPLTSAFVDFDDSLATRIAEADSFYEVVQSRVENADAKQVQRQALAGLVWTKQYFGYDVWRWMKGDPNQPPPPAERKRGRNSEWEHLKNADIISMPDKWEYPWFAAWDLAFHTLPFAIIDPAFAKHQLLLFLTEWYMHPNGQLPAYEWNFGDANPPVHAWACWRVYQIDRQTRGTADIDFLERAFHKLMLNFTWWVNRKDANGRNVFQGGFLGLDNIGVFDRSRPLPTGGFINQADATGWMAMYSVNLMRIGLELALHNPVYEDMAIKFFEHFLAIANAMTDMAGKGIGLWDEEDRFYYDELILPDGRVEPLRVRSMVGLIPLFAVEVLEPELLARLPKFARRLRWVLENRPDLAALVSRWYEPGRGEQRLLSLLRGHRMKKLLNRLLDPAEFLSDFGIRSLSKAHGAKPFSYQFNGETLTVDYQPGEATIPNFGGNSNWRGPIWFPVNYLIIESLMKFHHYYGDDFKIECPVGSGNQMTLLEAAKEIAARLSRIFLRDSAGRRPVNGPYEKFQTDPHFRDHVPFYEYFHGDSGMGLGASHQTGWTALVAKLLGSVDVIYSDLCAKPRQPDKA